VNLDIPAVVAGAVVIFGAFVVTFLAWWASRK
jgi:hypothetical protein